MSFPGPDDASAARLRLRDPPLAYIVLLAAMVAWAGLGGLAGLFRSWGALLIPIGYAVLFASFLFCSARRRRRIQRARERIASTALDLARAGSDAGEFVVYLRPFATNRELGMEARRAHARRVAQSAPQGSIGELLTESAGDMEGILADLLWPPVLLALGQPAESFGAARLPVEETEWRGVVERLVGRALGVILVPSTAGGTLWEMEQLVSRSLLGRTLFYVAPIGGEDGRRQWRDGACAMQRLGLPVDADALEDVPYPGGSFLKLVRSREGDHCLQLPISMAHHPYGLRIGEGGPKLTRELLLALLSPPSLDPLDPSVWRDDAKPADSQKLTLADGASVPVRLLASARSRCTEESRRPVKEDEEDA